MYHARWIRECTPCRADRERVATVGAARRDLRWYPKDRRDAKNIPGTVRPPRTLSGCHPKLDGDRRKWHSHPALASGGVQHKNTVGVEPLQAGTNGGRVGAYVSTGFTKRRRQAGANEVPVYRQSYLAVQVVSGHSSGQANGRARASAWGRLEVTYRGGTREA